MRADDKSPAWTTPIDEVPLPKPAEAQQDSCTLFKLAFKARYDPIVLKKSPSGTLEVFWRDSTGRFRG